MLVRWVGFLSDALPPAVCTRHFLQAIKLNTIQLGVSLDVAFAYSTVSNVSSYFRPTTVWQQIEAMVAVEDGKSPHSCVLAWYKPLLAIFPGTLF